MGTSKFMILVPLFDSKSLGSFRQLQCRDFKSAALGIAFGTGFIPPRRQCNEVVEC
jgi:hypothetical protein